MNSKTIAFGKMILSINVSVDHIEYIKLVSMEKKKSLNSMSFVKENLRKAIIKKILNVCKYKNISWYLI